MTHYEKPPAPLDRFLRLFGDVRGGEGLTALLLSLNVFLIFAAYYMIKPLRDGLIISEYSAEVKSYMAPVQILVLTLIVPLYGVLAGNEIVAGAYLTLQARKRRERQARKGAG